MLDLPEGGGVVLTADGQLAPIGGPLQAEHSDVVADRHVELRSTSAVDAGITAERSDGQQ